MLGASTSNLKVCFKVLPEHVFHHSPKDMFKRNRPGTRSWTVYAPEFPAAVSEEDPQEKLSPIQVLLVGNFYVNAVCEDRAAQVNEFHGTTIKAG